MRTMDRLKNKTKELRPMVIKGVSYTLVNNSKNKSRCLFCCFDENTCPDNGICLRCNGYWKLTYSVTKEDYVITSMPVDPLQYLYDEGLM